MTTTFDPQAYIKEQYQPKHIKLWVKEMDMSEEICTNYLNNCTQPSHVDEMLADYLTQ